MELARVFGPVQTLYLRIYAASILFIVRNWVPFSLEKSYDFFLISTTVPHICESVFFYTLFVPKCLSHLIFMLTLIIYFINFLIF
jgi:hypothetical protein